MPFWHESLREAAASLRCGVIAVGMGEPRPGLTFPFDERTHEPAGLIGAVCIDVSFDAGAGGIGNGHAIPVER